MRRQNQILVNYRFLFYSRLLKFLQIVLCLVILFIFCNAINLIWITLDIIANSFLTLKEYQTTTISTCFNNNRFPVHWTHLNSFFFSFQPNPPKIHLHQFQSKDNKGATKIINAISFDRIIFFILFTSSFSLLYDTIKTEKVALL